MVRGSKGRDTLDEVPAAPGGGWPGKKQDPLSGSPAQNKELHSPLSALAGTGQLRGSPSAAHLYLKTVV